MNNYYTLHSLVAEARYEILGKEITEVWSSRKDQIDFFFRHDPPRKLTFSAASPGTALFLDGRASPPSQNAAGFFPELEGLTVSAIGLKSPHDRFVLIGFHETGLELLFMPFTSRPNVFLVEKGHVISAFKNSRAFAGQVPPETMASPQLPETLAPGLPLRKKILAIDKRFPRGIMEDVADTCNLDALDETELRGELDTLQQKLLNPDSVYITAEGNLSLLPPQYLSHPPAHAFRTVNDAVRTLFLTKNRETRLLPRKKAIEKKLQRRISGLGKQMEAFRKEPERRKRAEELEQAGHLLMSQPGADRKVTEKTIRVTDWADDGNERDIPVTPGETLIQQAQDYYGRAARIRKEIDLSGKKQALVTAQREELQQLLEDVAGMEHPAELEKWLKRNESRLQQHGLASGGEQQVARPYRLIEIDGYDVWVGKNAKSNDKILALAHKEDIWMHARGTPGSHVVIRNRGEVGWPDSRLIRKAASLAAAYSRQAGSSMVPVTVAKRKHVRKPKGAPSGLVTVTRERVEMVEPGKPEAPES